MNKLPFKNYIYSALIINIFVIAFCLVIQSRLPPEIPLFYGLPQGQEQLTKPIGLLIPACFSLAFILTNLLLTRLTTNEFLKKALAVASFATSILAAITSIKIAFLVGNI